MKNANITGTWDALNALYEPLYHRLRELHGLLSATGHESKWAYYAFHAARREGLYKTEYFPIPVITVGNTCDIGLEIDHIFVEGMLTRAQALAFDWLAIKCPFEVYGGEDYTGDFYRPDMSLDGLPQRIAQSSEEVVGLQLILPQDCRDEDILRIVDSCKRWDTHIL